MSTGRTFKMLNAQQLFSASTNPIGIPDAANQTEIFQTLKQKERKRGTAEKAMLIIMREMREQKEREREQCGLHIAC